MRTCNHKGCNRLVFSTDKKTNLGYCQYHWKSDRTDIDKRSIIQKAAAKIKEKSNEVVIGNHYDNWFWEKRKEMKGVCDNCDGKTGKDDDKFFKHCIAHVLPKKLFPSVATHPLNWIELCFWNNSCHSKYDQSWEKASQMRIFPKAISIIEKLYPLLTREERRKLPEIVIQELNPELLT